MRMRKQEIGNNVNIMESVLHRIRHQNLSVCFKLHRITNEDGMSTKTTQHPLKLLGEKTDRLSSLCKEPDQVLKA
jgi:hypothetical protein